MLPEGTLDNLKIPGLPEGMTEKIGKGVEMFNQAKDAFEKFGGADAIKAFTGGTGGKQAQEFEDFEEFMDFDFDEDMTDLKFIGGESDGEFAQRVELRN